MNKIFPISTITNFLLLFSSYSVICLLPSSTSTIKLNYLPKNKFFTVPLEIGTAKENVSSQIFEVQIDTTTSETWIPSSKANQTFEPRFYNELSLTSNATNKTIEVDDEDGNVHGKATFDKIKLSQYNINNFGFVQITNYDSNFKDYSIGKLGLGYKQNYGDSFNFVKMLKKQGFIKKAVFTINPFAQEILFGEPIPKKAFTNCNITETDDLDDKYRAGWVCELTHVFLNSQDKKISLFDENSYEVNARAIFDSAYQYISIPKTKLKLFKEKYIFPIFNDTCSEIRENRERYFVCDFDNEKMKKSSIKFVIGGYSYVLTYDKLFSINEGKAELLIRFKEENDNIWSFGAPFVDQHIISYDYENKTVGFSEGEKINLESEWNAYIRGESPINKEKMMKMLIIGASVIGGVLLLVVICLFCKKSDVPGPQI